MRHGWAPATLNLEYLDPKCPIRPVPAPGVAANLKAGASVSVGFGGQVGVVLATQPEETP
jgi:3-oxoacyl-(acyl-carrier-protein) synthase